MTDPVSLTLVRYPPRNLAGRRGRRHVRVPARGIGVAAASLFWLPGGFHLGQALAGGTGLAADAVRLLHVAALATGGAPLPAARAGRLKPGRGLLADHPVAVPIPHEPVGRVAARHRRDAVAPRLPAGDAAVAVIVPPGQRIG